MPTGSARREKRPVPECWRPNSFAAPHRSTAGLGDCDSVAATGKLLQLPADTWMPPAPGSADCPDKGQPAPPDRPIAQGQEAAIGARPAVAALSVHNLERTKWLQPERAA